MAASDLQYVTDENGKPTAVLVPIDLWREIASERETAHLLKSETMRRRLMEAINREDRLVYRVFGRKDRRAQTERDAAY